MKQMLIFFTIFFIAFLAFFDAKDRIAELDSVAANTPSQVEMKQMINKPIPQMKEDIIQNKQNIQDFSKKMNESIREHQQNQLDNIDKRREIINNQAQ